MDFSHPKDKSEKVSTEAQERLPGTGFRTQKVKNAAVAVSCFLKQKARE